MVTMISKAPTTVSGVSAWYSAANPCTRATLAAASCSPRMPSPGKVGVPYRATIRRPGKRICPPPGSSTPVAAVQPTATIGIGSGFGVSDTLAWKIATAATGVELPGGGQILFPGRRMVALYGTPIFPALGILGEQDPAASVARVQGLAAEYQALTPDTVVGAFEIIVTVASCSPRMPS